METTELRIATRRSPLALWQAQHVADLLAAVDPAVRCTLVPSDTFADLDLSTSIADLGGKGAFSKEIQQIVLAGHADIAVHSAKDLQAVTPDELALAAFPERGDPCDALVGSTTVELNAAFRSAGSGHDQPVVVASGSNRRRALLLSRCPGVEFVDLRGNIATRLGQLASGVGPDGGTRPHALVMAAAALERLGLTPEVMEVLDPEDFVPQVGQGALAVEVLGERTDLIEIVGAINHVDTELAVRAERSFLGELGGDCTLPAGAHATVTHTDSGPRITISGVLAGDDYGNLQRWSEVGGPEDEPGRELARNLRKRIEAAVS